MFHDVWKSKELGVTRWPLESPGDGRTHIWWLMLVLAGPLSGREFTWLGLPHNMADGLREPVLELREREKAS